MKPGVLGLCIALLVYGPSFMAGQGLWFAYKNPFSQSASNNQQYSQQSSSGSNYYSSSVFTITLSNTVVTIPCSLALYGDIGIHVTSSSNAQLPLQDCLFNVIYANGTSPDDSIGGFDDTYGSFDFGPCPFQFIPGDTDQQLDNTTFVCPNNTQNSVNVEFDHVLTAQYVLVDNSTNELYLAPQELLFIPPLTFPFLFVPSPDFINDVINQFYSVSCIDAAGRTSNTAFFQMIYPSCP